MSYASNSESPIKRHADYTDHNIHPRNARILERTTRGFNCSRGTLHLHSDAVNDRKPLPPDYVQQPKTFKGQPCDARIVALIKADRRPRKFKISIKHRSV